MFTTKRYYTMGGITVAVRDSAGTGSLNYLLGDQLGSTTVSINAAGGTPVVQRYLPYGAPRSTTGGNAVTDRGWIGQTKDNSTGLQYLNARYYDPTIGRFTAVDPIVDVEQPGSLDRFGYGLDNPTTLKDPTGLRVCDDPRECKALNVNPSGRPLGGGKGGGQLPGSSQVRGEIERRDAIWWPVSSLRSLIGGRNHNLLINERQARVEIDRSDLGFDLANSSCVPYKGMCWGIFAESETVKFEVELHVLARRFGADDDELIREYTVKGILEQKHVYSSAGVYDPQQGNYDRVSDLDDLFGTDALGPSHRVEESFTVTHWRDANVVSSYEWDRPRYRSTEIDSWEVE